jgi:hypothetical protein
MDKRRREKG